MNRAEHEDIYDIELSRCKSYNKCVLQISLKKCGSLSLDGYEIYEHGLEIHFCSRFKTIYQERLKMVNNRDSHSVMGLLC